MSSNHNYYKEIDGLRAISVLVIIFFHLKMGAFQGGFIGVDVFFVVSGYLITRIIVSSLDQGQFSFKDFYVRRSTRILPALAATILFTLAFALFLQQPDALLDTAKQSIAALLSLSNFFFWSESSYWAPSAENYVLLHTWSLGVEEQFYIIYPLLLFVSHRIAGLKGVATLLVLIVVVGTGMREITLQTDPSKAFYFTPLRFYEFAVGGLGMVLASKLDLSRLPAWATSLATLSGIALILFAAATFSGNIYSMPGLGMYLPMSGALLILLAGASPCARILLTNPPMSWMGKTSYALYLVHWPIIVFYRYYYGSNLSLIEQTALFILILVSAEVLSRLVERRFRLVQGGGITAGGTSSRAVLLGTLATTLFICLVAGILVANQGWTSRMSPQALELMEIDPNREVREDNAFVRAQCVPKGPVFCGERKPGRSNLILLGDSRGVDMYIALTTAYPEVTIRAAIGIGCVPVFAVDVATSPFYPNCPGFNQKRLKIALEAPKEDIIFLALNLNEFRLEAILETVNRLRATGKTVYVLGQTVFVEGRTPIQISIDAARFQSDADFVGNFTNRVPFEYDGEFADKIRATGAIYISSKNFFYDGTYHFEDRDSGKLLTYDGLHLNRFGAELFGRYLRQYYPLH